MAKKPQYEDYPNWLRKDMKVVLRPEYKAYYDAVTTNIKSSMEQSEFWQNFLKNFREYHDEYLINTSYALLINPDITMPIYIKPYDSFLQKTYRKNILDNINFPNAPKDGWVLPGNWFEKIKDVIRTQISVKYLDGVEFVASRIQTYCTQNGYECPIDYEAKEEGYYAAHLSFSKSFEIPKYNWDTQHVNVYVEVQITTQVQEVIKKLLHKYYEDRRMGEEKPEKWQWDYRSDEFAVNYLGHILHYVEGMIMDIRDKQKDKDRKL